MVNRQLAAEIKDVDDEVLEIVSIASSRTYRHSESINKWMHSAEDQNELLDEANCSQTNCRRDRASQEVCQETDWKARDVNPVTITDDATQNLIRQMTVGKNLPTFDGDVLEWPASKRAFEEQQAELNK